ncbi:MAG TPA: copper oxidase, partial [Thermoanaerobaculia bacterium]|nr:copper oxidase [Thermoanaerobaculia bacterium]
MAFNRRSFLQSALATVGLGASSVAFGQHADHRDPEAPGHPGGGQSRFWRSRSGIVPVDTPDVPKLPWQMENGVKVFHIVAEPVKTEFLPGRPVDAWGFNGSVPGPTIEVNQGDRVRLVVENRLPEVFTMHWHGFEIPIEMDGVPGVTQDPIPPGGKFVYEFTLHQHGTFFYHSHMPMQQMMGMIGLFVMHPREPYRPKVDRDFGLIFQEWAILPNNTVPNTLSMEFNWLTINGKAGPATTPLLVRLGERVRIRMVNLGMDHHPIHLHGHTFYTTGTEAGRIPKAAWEPGNTVLLGVAQARDLEFDAVYPGDWMLHCHLPNHMMNAMSSVVGRMTRGSNGVPSGVGMAEGMGIMKRGNALSDDKGPSLGRGMGVGSTMDERSTNGPLSQQAMRAMPRMQNGNMEGMGQTKGDIASNANSVPGFPQDAFMEGPMMAMD